MRKAVVQPARCAVPKRAQVFGVATTKILRCANVLRRSKTCEEVIIGRPEERAVTIDRRLTDYSRLMNVVVLESIVDDSICQLVTVVMTVGATCATLRHLRGEDLFSARNLRRLIARRKLGQRIWQ